MKTFEGNLEAKVMQICERVRTKANMTPRDFDMSLASRIRDTCPALTPRAVPPAQSSWPLSKVDTWTWAEKVPGWKNGLNPTKTGC